MHVGEQNIVYCELIDKLSDRDYDSEPLDYVIGAWDDKTNCFSLFVKCLEYNIARSWIRRDIKSSSASPNRRNLNDISHEAEFVT